jgi:hypothetical protein
MKKTNEMAQLTGDSFQVSPEAQTGQESDQPDRKQRRKAEDAPGPQHLSFDVGKIQRKGEPGGTDEKQKRRRFALLSLKNRQAHHEQVREQPHESHRNTRNLGVRTPIHGVAVKSSVDVAKRRRILSVVMS